MPAQFALHVSLGFGCGASTANTLNQACLASETSTFSKSMSSTFGGLTASWFGSGGGSHNVSGSAPDTRSSYGTNPSVQNSDKCEERQRFFVASASHLELSVDDKSRMPSLLRQASFPPTFAVLVPPSLIASCLEKHTSHAESHASGSCFWITEGESSSPSIITQHLLPQIHKSLTKCRIKGIILTSIASEENAPAEWLILQSPQSAKTPSDSGKAEITTTQDLLELTQGQGMTSHPEAILKLLPLSQIHFKPQSSTPAVKDTSVPAMSTASIPTCAVCLHRIDPIRLGLPPPGNSELCSKFCPPPNLLSYNRAPGDSGRNSDSCPKQLFLRPWESRCQACRVIDQYWNGNMKNDDSRSPSHTRHFITDRPIESKKWLGGDTEATDIFCGECAMHKTLWVCLTCGFVGCGRYSNKHSVRHFQETHHPYSLELATLRIWDYVHEGQGYAHRTDLLECPSSPPLAQPWSALGRAGYPDDASSTSDGRRSSDMSNHPNGVALLNYYSSADVIPEKNPKKATMIGEEYEALLHSALEDQAQHYEGEMARLRAELTATLVDQTSLTEEEQAEMEKLQAGIAQMRSDCDQASRSLLDAQAQEAGHRATSQRLLQEQQEANQVLKQIEQDAHQEAERGKLQVEDLEQQVRDLTANLKMRQQFSQSEELSKAQIFGTAGEPNSPSRLSARRGKKKGRFFRK